jgi:hypothetical protein
VHIPMPRFGPWAFSRRTRFGVGSALVETRAMDAGVLIAKLKGLHFIALSDNAFRIWPGQNAHNLR